MKAVLTLILTIFYLGFTQAKASTESTPSSVIFEDSTISYQVYGQGELTLVFVHGWSCDSHYWQQQIDRFSQDFKVVTVDLAGHGNSVSNRDDYTIDSFALDVAAVVNNENLQQVILVGHSMGATVTVEAAHLLGDKVIGVISVDALLNVTLRVQPGAIPAIIAPFKADFSSAAEAFVDTMFLESAEPQLVDWIKRDMSSAPEKVAINSFENYLIYYSGDRSIKSFLNFHLPIVSINARQRPTNVDANREAIGDYEVVFIEDSGHFPMLEKPEAFNELLQSAVEQISANKR